MFGEIFIVKEFVLSLEPTEIDEVHVSWDGARCFLHIHQPSALFHCELSAACVLKLISELQAKESTKASANPQSVSASQIALCVTEAIQAMGDDHCDRAAMILTDVIGQLHTL